MSGHKPISREEFVEREGEGYVWIFEKLTKDGFVLLDREGWLKVQEHIEKFPSCTKDCPVFEGFKVHPNRALACETARAIDDCPKDKWYAELVRRLK